jgi:hypothetical protein
VAPVIDPGYYADPRDLDLMVTALHRVREMGNADALRQWRTGELATVLAIAERAGGISSGV